MEFFSIVLLGWRSTGIVCAEKNARSDEIRLGFDFVSLLTVCYNKFVPVVSTSSVPLCGRINFLHFEILALLLR